MLSFIYLFIYLFFKLEGAAVEGKAEDGQTPLHVASLWGHTECVQLLLSHGEQELPQVNTTTKGLQLTNLCFWWWWWLLLLRGQPKCAEHQEWQYAAPRGCKEEQLGSSESVDGRRR